MAVAAPYLSGLLLGGSLIVAIGAQNAFVLKQGLISQHVLAVCLICSLADGLLIAAGVAGFGTLVASNPALISAVTLGGAAFLAIYAGLAFRRAFGSKRLVAEGGNHGSLRSAILTVLALTFLNPHVYLDTVILIGSLSGRYPQTERLAFASGAVSASFVWFFGLGYGARLLAPFFARPISWRMLDLIIAIIMAGLSLSLAMRFLEH